MALEHDRLTAEETKQVVDLAARLQAEHERTYGVSEVAAAASEAGIEARFVEEAARRLRAEPVSGMVSQSRGWKASPWTLVIDFVAAFAIGTLYADSKFRSTTGDLSWLVPLIIPAAFASAFGRRRVSHWAPALLAGLGFFVGIVVGSSILSGGFHVYGAASENTPLVLFAMMAAGFGSLVSGYYDDWPAE